jgi:Family of unknown function (DUF6455)
LIYLKSEPPLLRYLSQPTGRSAMPSSENSDFQELQVYKMMERLGIELGAGVIPRYGLMYVSAVRNCRSCGAAATCTEWLGAASSIHVTPGFCPNRDIFLELAYTQTARRSTAKH